MTRAAAAVHQEVNRGQDLHPAAAEAGFAGVGQLRHESKGEPIEVIMTREAGRPSIGRADDGVRTRDPQLGKLMLYQLSYVRVGRL